MGEVTQEFDSALVKCAGFFVLLAPRTQALLLFRAPLSAAGAEVGPPHPQLEQGPADPLLLVARPEQHPHPEREAGRLESRPPAGASQPRRLGNLEGSRLPECLGGEHEDEEAQRHRQAFGITWHSDDRGVAAEHAAHPGPVGRAGIGQLFAVEAELGLAFFERWVTGQPCGADRAEVEANDPPVAQQVLPQRVPRQVWVRQQRFHPRCPQHVLAGLPRQDTDELERAGVIGRGSGMGERVALTEANPQSWVGPEPGVRRHREEHVAPSVHYGDRGPP